MSSCSGLMTSTSKAVGRPRLQHGMRCCPGEPASQAVSQGSPWMEPEQRTGQQRGWCHGQHCDGHCDLYSPRSRPGDHRTHQQYGGIPGRGMTSCGGEPLACSAGSTGTRGRGDGGRGWWRG